MDEKKHKILRYFIIFLCLWGALILASPVRSQTSLSWNTPQIIPGLIDTGIYPIMLSDSEGTIHIFQSQPTGGNTGVFYTRWSHEKGWSNLVDIITSPHGDARAYGATLDEKGWIHILYWGGEAGMAEMYHTKAPIKNVDTSTSWTEPVLVGDSALDPPTAALIRGMDGSLIVIYSSDIRGNGLYVTRSYDNGATWEDPKSFFLTYNNFLWPSELDTYSDTDGNIFAAWAVGDESGNSQAVYYSHLNAEDQQWSQPYKIADAINYEADTPSIIKYKDQLMLIYHNDFPTTRWMQTSTDNGKTWSSPERLFEQVGSNGSASLIIDNNDTLHIFFGNRIDATATHGAWHSIWLGNRWSKPEAIVSGPMVLVGPNGEEGFGPSFMDSVISKGNLLFVIWRHDPVAGPTNIWYTFQFLDAPEEPVTPVPTVDHETQTLTIQPSNNIPYTPESVTILVDNNQIIPEISPSTEAQPSNINNNILIGIIPIALIVFLIVLWQKKKQRF